MVPHCRLNLHSSDRWLCDSLCTFPSGCMNLDPVLLEKQEELMPITLSLISGAALKSDFFVL